ncbi:MAG: hypothetical protein HYT76_02780 [Deltaproteobacteria bacterium]|nr:hypothetical protein [Deltaproteobacteria bacterium]
MKETITIKDVFSIPDREGDGKQRWTKIGVGFLNRDSSINVILDAYPLNGRLHIRDRQDKNSTQRKGEE